MADMMARRKVDTVYYVYKRQASKETRSGALELDSKSSTMV